MLNLTVIMKMQIKTIWFRFPPIRLFKKKTAISGYGKDGGYAGGERGGGVGLASSYFVGV